MSLWIRILFCIFAISSGVALNGCSPVQSQSDEEKEPHYVLGRSRVNAMDYQGAVDAFEESLEVNPRSAAAHFELGWLYEQKVPDPAAAIFHYQRYLKLNPNASDAALIKQHIDACKQQLAADVLALPSASATQQQLEKLVEQNRQLQDELNRWQAYAAQLAKTNAVVQNNSILPTPNPISQNTQNNSAQTSGGNTPRPITTTAQARTHTVVSGETAAAISRKFNVRLSALESANPGINLSKLRVGQVLKIP